MIKIGEIPHFNSIRRRKTIHLCTTHAIRDKTIFQFSGEPEYPHGAHWTRKRDDASLTTFSQGSEMNLPSAERIVRANTPLDSVLDCVACFNPLHATFPDQRRCDGRGA